MEVDTCPQQAEPIAETLRIHPHNITRMKERERPTVRVCPLEGVLVNLLDIHDIGICSVPTIMKVHQRGDGAAQDGVTDIDAWVGVVKPVRPLPPEDIPA